MPRLTNETPKYRRHASGNARVRINGKDIYLGAYGTAESRREYNRIIGEWLTNHRTLPLSARGSGYSMAELMAAYWRHAQEYYAVAAGKSDGELWSIKMALRMVKKLYLSAEVADFGPLAMRAVRDAMVKEDWSRTYCNVQVNRLRRMFKWGVEHELVPADIWHALKAVEALKSGKTSARENQPVSTVSDEYVEAALPWLNRQVRTMVELQSVTGMRPGEVVIMRGMDITTSNAKLWEYRPPHHKNTHRGQERTIYLNAEAQGILKPLLKRELSAYIFSPIDADAERRAAMHANRKTPINAGNRPGTNRSRKPRRAPGECYDVTSYRRAIARACDLADEWARGGRVIDSKVRLIPRWNPHQIRHNVATKLRAKHGLEAAQVILGHKTLTATQIYAEKNIEKAKQIMMEGGR
jgi:integrase